MILSLLTRSTLLLLVVNHSVAQEWYTQDNYGPEFYSPSVVKDTPPSFLKEREAEISANESNLVYLPDYVSNIRPKRDLDDADNEQHGSDITEYTPNDLLGHVDELSDSKVQSVDPNSFPDINDQRVTNNSYDYANSDTSNSYEYPQSDTNSNGNSVTNADVNSDTNSDVNSDTNSDVNSDTNRDVNSDTNSDVNSEANSDTNIVTKNVADGDANIVTSSDTNSDVNSDINSDVSSDTNSNVNSDINSDGNSDTNSDVNSEANSDANIVTKNVTDSDANIVTSNDTNSDVNSDTNTDASNDANIVTKNVTDSDANSNVNSVTHTETSLYDIETTDRSNDVMDEKDEPANYADTKDARNNEVIQEGSGESFQADDSHTINKKENDSKTTGEHAAEADQDNQRKIVGKEQKNKTATAISSITTSPNESGSGSFRREEEEDYDDDDDDDDGDDDELLKGDEDENEDEQPVKRQNLGMKLM